MAGERNQTPILLHHERIVFEKEEHPSEFETSMREERSPSFFWKAMQVRQILEAVLYSKSEG